MAISLPDLYKAMNGGDSYSVADLNKYTWLKEKSEEGIAVLFRYVHLEMNYYM